jgi:hypothetical protein
MGGFGFMGGAKPSLQSDGFADACSDTANISYFCKSKICCGFMGGFGFVGGAKPSLWRGTPSSMASLMLVLIQQT